MYRSIKWICPTAPTRPVSRLGGAVTTAWCDVTQVSENMEHDLASINTTCVLVANLLAGEPAHVMKGVGGIGLGAAQALYFASCYVVGGMRDMGLNAVVGINGWLPAWTNFLYHIDSLTVSGTLAASLPILLTNENSMVPFQFGWLSEQSLSRAGGILQLLEIGSKHTSSSRTNARILAILRSGSPPFPTCPRRLSETSLRTPGAQGRLHNTPCAPCSSLVRSHDSLSGFFAK
ncbi:hypothetical protein Bca101_005328 [Brassica carinata]